MLKEKLLINRGRSGELPLPGSFAGVSAPRPTHSYREFLPDLSEESHRLITAGLLDVDAQCHLGIYRETVELFGEMHRSLNRGLLYASIYDAFADPVSRESTLSDVMLNDTIPRLVAEALIIGRWDRAYSQGPITQNRMDAISSFCGGAISAWTAFELRRRPATPAPVVLAPASVDLMARKVEVLQYQSAWKAVEGKKRRYDDIAHRANRSWNDRSVIDKYLSGAGRVEEERLIQKELAKRPLP